MGLVSVGLLGLALLLRLRHLGYTEMWGDQSMILTIAQEWVRGGPFPLASMKSSFGVFHPPLVEYLLAIPLFFSANLLGVVWFIALFNLVGIAIAGWATAKVWGWRMAAGVTLLFIVNPWASYYARLIWMPSFVPGCAALLYACAVLYLTQPQHATRYLVLGAIAFAATIQTHPTAVVLAPAFFIVGLCCPARLKHWRSLASVGVFALCFLPTFLFQLQTNFADWHALRAGFGQPAETNAAAFLITLDLLHAKGIYATLGSGADQWQALDGLGAWSDGVLTLGLGLGLVTMVILTSVQITRSWRARQPLPALTAVQLLLVLWLSLPLLFYVRHSQYLQNYYFLYLLPIPFVLLAWVTEQGYGWLTNRLAGWSALAFVPLVLVAAQQARLAWVGQDLQAAGIAGKARVIDVQQAIDTAQTVLAAHPACPLVVIDEGGLYENSRFGLLRAFLAAPVRFLPAGANSLLPTPCAVYFDTTANPLTSAWLTDLTQPTTTIHTPEQIWTFYALATEARAEALQHFIHEPHRGVWANGLELHHLETAATLQPGQPLAVFATWRVTQAVPPHPLHFGLYLLQNRTTLITQVDGPGVDSTQWQVGDVFGTAFTLQIPNDLAPGDYELAFALYRYPEIERIPLAAEAGDLLWLERLTVR